MGGALSADVPAASATLKHSKPGMRLAIAEWPPIHRYPGNANVLGTGIAAEDGRYHATGFVLRFAQQARC